VEDWLNAEQRILGSARASTRLTEANTT
jgi:hypothetical protein